MRGSSDEPTNHQGAETRVGAPLRRGAGVQRRRVGVDRGDDGWDDDRDDLDLVRDGEDDGGDRDDRGGVDLVDIDIDDRGGVVDHRRRDCDRDGLLVPV